MKALNASGWVAGVAWPANLPTTLVAVTIVNESPKLTFAATRPAREALPRLIEPATCRRSLAWPRVRQVDEEDVRAVQDGAGGGEGADLWRREGDARADRSAQAGAPRSTRSAHRLDAAERSARQADRPEAPFTSTVPSSTMVRAWLLPPVAKIKVPESTLVRSKAAPVVPPARVSAVWAVAPIAVLAASSSGPAQPLLPTRLSSRVLPADAGAQKG